MNAKALIQLIRLHNTTASALSALAGYLIASQWLINNLHQILLAALVVALISAAGYIINDIYDVEIDKINKPYRPLPSGRVSLKEAWIVTYIFFGLGLLFSLILGILPFLVALIVAFSLVVYSKILKRKGLYGNVLIALDSSLTFFYGGLVYGTGEWLLRITLPVFFAFILTLAREFVKGIEDYNGDKLYGVNTLAVKLGIEKTWEISKILLIILLIISPIPVLIGFNFIYIIFLILVIIFIIITIFSKNTINSAIKARSYLKIASILGILAFLLGSI